MTKFSTFASDIKVNALLCCSAAVLFAAGGLVQAAEQGQVAAQAASSEAQAAADFTVRGYDSDSAQAAQEAAANGADTNLMVSTESKASAATSSARSSRTVGATGTVSAPAPAATLNATVSMAPTKATTYNYYVAPNGSDSAAGTKSAPWRTIARAIKSVRANSTVWVAPGTYEGGFRNNTSGTSTGRIYFVSTTKWGAKIVPPATSRNDMAFDNRGSYVDIVGFEINGSATRSGTKWDFGIYNGGSYNNVRDNWVHHIAKTVSCTSAGGSGITVDSYYKGVSANVLNNVVHDIGPGTCHFIQGIYVSTTGTVKNNVVYRISEAAIHLWHDARNVIITNNTVAASTTGIIVGGGDFYHTTTGANNVLVYSNIVYDNKNGISEQGKTGTGNRYGNNLVYKNSSYNWSLRNGLKHTGTITSDPLFTSYTRTGTPNFKPSVSSPVIGRGTSTHAHPTDIVGRPRNSTTGFDIGAYQH